MAGGSVRGFAAGALGLVVLQTLVQDKAAGQVAGLWGVLSNIVTRVMDPNVAAIPDHSSSSSSSSGGVGGDGKATGAGVLDPQYANLPNAAAIVAAQQAAAGAAAAGVVAPIVSNPSSWLNQLNNNLAPLGPGYQYPKAPPATAVR